MKYGVVTRAVHAENTAVDLGLANRVTACELNDEKKDENEGDEKRDESSEGDGSEVVEGEFEFKAGIWPARGVAEEGDGKGLRD